jgi:hypothetical protein
LTPHDVSQPDLGTPARPQPADFLALTIVGLAIGLWMRGHFPVPYSDFMDFVDPGHDLWQGRLPHSLRRAPFYPLLVTALGHCFVGEAPDRTAAGWLNTLLLPVNAILIYRIGLDWFGRASRWAAIMFLFTPLSIFLTGHEIVEPLLTFLILSTVRAAQWRDATDPQAASRMRQAAPYALAALAAITRYDTAGLIVGLMLADTLRRQQLARVALRGGAALLPMAVWLALTWLTWHKLGKDHYVELISRRPLLETLSSLPHDLLWSIWVIQAAIFDGTTPRLGFWLQPFAEPLAAGSSVALGGLALLGAGTLARSGGSAFWTAAVAYVCYVLVHALFPFRLERFGYPMSPLLLLAAFAGGRWLLSARILAELVLAARRFAVPLLAILFAAGIIGEMSVPAVPRGGQRIDPAGLVLTLVAAACATALFIAPAGRRLARSTLVLGAVLFLLLQARAAGPLLRWGFELANEVDAARWIRRYVPQDDGVLSIMSPLLRLYVGRSPLDRFVEFPEIEADGWDDILSECRRRRIRWIVWHDQMSEQFGEMLDRWRMERFNSLGQGEPPPGLEQAHFIPDRPNLWIYRIRDEAAGGESAP